MLNVNFEYKYAIESVYDFIYASEILSQSFWRETVQTSQCHAVTAGIEPVNSCTEIEDITSSTEKRNRYFYVSNIYQVTIGNAKSWNVVRLSIYLIV